MTVAGTSHGGAGEAAWPSSSWLSSLPLCCAPLAACSDKRPRRIDEKHSHPVIYDQPLYHPRPVAVPMGSSHRNVLEKYPRETVAPKRKRFWSLSSGTSATSTTSRRPPISAPQDFRHIYSASPKIPDVPEPTPSRASNLRPAKQLPHRPYRPLELSIYEPANRVSPILPHFNAPPFIPTFSSEVSSGCMSDRAEWQSDEGNRPVEHQKSFSDSPMSFHFPRRQALESSPSTSQDDEIPPLIPPRARSRPRAYTSPVSSPDSSPGSSPNMEKIKERVASAMLEVEKLQKQIDDVIERQSLYTPSRPSTPHSTARTMPELEPMPSIPALPPAAPSFAERLTSDIDRPHTAPIRTPPTTPPNRVIANPPRRARTPGAPSTPTSTPPRTKRADVPLPPPLPLVLRPPLRKKKSFSRVSSWLFPASQHSRNLSFDSVTNAPRPIKGNEGFYQVSLGETSGRRRSTDSADTVSTWESDDEGRTVPTSCSLGSTPAVSQDEPLISRFATFGRGDTRPNRTSVGVAI
ncbi:hypothetical protein CEP52_007130 [Fusarium oligoseptatum]|uniref:Uncharacterized protein n=1 Tax=Fusarium oligoseptatum TaxID=2604345 RepID=A0A428TPI9_9HYPO|nr:hypothetical protein CEP52_007130 [Fusarium oligoseptatum]